MRMVRCAPSSGSLSLLRIALLSYDGPRGNEVPHAPLMPGAHVLRNAGRTRLLITEMEEASALILPLPPGPPFTPRLPRDDKKRRESQSPVSLLLIVWFDVRAAEESWLQRSKLHLLIILPGTLPWKWAENWSCAVPMLDRRRRRRSNIEIARDQRIWIGNPPGQTVTSQPGKRQVPEWSWQPALVQIPGRSQSYEWRCRDPVIRGQRMDKVWHTYNNAGHIMNCLLLGLRLATLCGSRVWLAC